MTQAGRGSAVFVCSVLRSVGLAALLLTAFLVSPSLAEAAFPGPNGKIAFERGGDIWAINADGTNLTDLTGPISNSASFSELQPAWSPDGGTIAFSTDRDRNFEIYTLKLDGRALVDVSHSPSLDGAPTFSPDGKEIAFVRDGDIWKMNANGGTDQKDLTNSPTSDDENPAWSPIGGRIAFERDSSVYVMNEDGAGQTKLADLGTDPSWSPDGRRLAFSTFNEIGSDYTHIRLINGDGSSPFELTSTGGFFDDHSPSWSPNGSRLAFVTNQTNHTDAIFILNRDGSNLQQLTFNETVDAGPDWGTGPAPIASFSTSPDPALSGQNVSFDATSSSALDGIVDYSWDLDGDGSFETDSGHTPSTSRSYPTAGTRVVGVRVTDHNSNVSETHRTITVKSRPPSAFVAIAPNPAFTGQTVTFDGSASSDPDGVITRYQWDLDGDGTFEKDTGARSSVSRTYTKPGRIRVKLRVTDNDGVTNEGVGGLSARVLSIVSRRILSEATLIFRDTSDGIRIRSLVLRSVPRGASVEIACAHARRNTCPHQRRKAKGGVLSFRALHGERLRAGTLVEIRITKHNYVGKYIAYKIRRGGFKKSEGCLEGSRRPKTRCDDTRNLAFSVRLHGVAGGSVVTGTG